MLIDVAVGLVFNAEGQILITQRGEDVSHPFYWEFPGGKVEEGEDIATALVRELKEEINIDCKEIMPWMSHTHSFGDYSVRLHIFLVTAYNGEVKCLETQADMKWVNFQELPQFQFPDSNLMIIQRLSLLTVAELLGGFGIGGIGGFL